MSLVKKIKDSPFYSRTKKVCKDLQGDELVLVTSVVGIMVAMAWSDEQLHKHELIFLQRLVGQLCGLDEKISEAVILENIGVVSDKKDYHSYLGNFGKFIRHSLPEQLRNQFIIAVMAISLGDEELDQREEDFLKELVFDVGVLPEEYNAFMLEAKALIDQLKADLPVT